MESWFPSDAVEYSVSCRDYADAAAEAAAVAAGVGAAVGPCGPRGPRRQAVDHVLYTDTSSKVGYALVKFRQCDSVTISGQSLSALRTKWGHGMTAVGSAGAYGNDAVFWPRPSTAVLPCPCFDGEVPMLH